MKNLTKALIAITLAAGFSLATVNFALAHDTIVYASSTTTWNGSDGCADRGDVLSCSLEYLREVCIRLKLGDTTNPVYAPAPDPSTDLKALKGPKDSAIVTCAVK